MIQVQCGLLPLHGVESTFFHRCDSVHYAFILFVSSIFYLTSQLSAFLNVEWKPVEKIRAAENVISCRQLALPDKRQQHDAAAAMRTSLRTRCPNFTDEKMADESCG